MLITGLTGTALPYTMESMTKKVRFSRSVYGSAIFLVPVVLGYLYFTRRQGAMLADSSRLFMRFLSGESVESELSKKPNIYGTVVQILSVIRKYNTGAPVSGAELEIVHRNPHFKPSVAVATLGGLMGDYCQKRNSPWATMMEFLTTLAGRREARLGALPFYNPLLIGTISDVKEDLIDGTADKCTKYATG
jgi:hypothetical protein